MKLNQLLLAGISVALVACGGGGGGDASPAPQPTPTADSGAPDAPEPADTPEPPAVIETTSDITTSETFKFTSSYSVNVDLSVSDDQMDQVFVNLCSGFESAGDGYEIDYDSCLVRSSLPGGRYTGEILVPNHVDSLLAEIRFFDADKSPDYQLWSNLSDGSTLVLP